MISLKAANGLYVQRVGDTLIANLADGTLPAAQVTEEILGVGVVALKQGGSYWSAQPDGTLQCNRPSVGSWEAFQRVKGERDGSVAYMAVKFGTFISAKLDGVVPGLLNCRAEKLHDWESFNSTSASGTGSVQLVHVEALRFVNADGSTYVARWATGFLDYRRYLNGESIAGLLQETVDARGNGRRVFSLVPRDGGWPADVGLLPSEHLDYYDKLRPFADLLASFGLTFDFCVFTREDLMPSLSDRQTHWNRIVDALQGAPNVFLELMNENHESQRGAFSRPTGIPSSLGSMGGDADPPKPCWDWSGYEPRRDEPKVWVSSTDLFWAVNGWSEGIAGFTGTHQPTLNIEGIGAADTDVPGRRSANPSLFYIMGVESALYGAGGCFHSDAGVYSLPWTPTQRACAEAYFSGLLSVTR